MTERRFVAAHDVKKPKPFEMKPDIIKAFGGGWLWCMGVPVSIAAPTLGNLSGYIRELKPSHKVELDRVDHEIAALKAYRETYLTYIWNTGDRPTRDTLKEYIRNDGK